MVPIRDRIDVLCTKALPIFPDWTLNTKSAIFWLGSVMITRLAIESEGKFSWVSLRIHRKINVKSGGKMNHYDEMSRTLQISNTSITKGWYFCQLLIKFHANVRSRRIAYNCIEVQLSELSCLSAVSDSVFFFFFFFFFFCFFLWKFFEVGYKIVSESPPPPPPLGFAAFFGGGAFVPFLGWPWCPFAWPKCPPKSKVPFL